MEKIIENLEFENIFDLVYNIKKYSSKNDCTLKRGIYFLFNDDIITYIGISQNINESIFDGRTAHKTNKKFNNYSFLEIDKPNNELEILEKILINYFDPKDNTLYSYKKYVENLPIWYKTKNENYKKEIQRKMAHQMISFFY
jgi:hypothetical protein